MEKDGIRRAQRKHPTGLSEVIGCPRGPAEVGSPGFALRSPGGGGRELRNLQGLGRGGARELSVRVRVGGAGEKNHSPGRSVSVLGEVKNPATGSRGPRPLLSGLLGLRDLLSGTDHTLS